MKAVWFFLLAMLALENMARADDAPDKNRASIAVMLENDSFIGGVDRHYTNGLYVSWTGAAEQRDDAMAGWLSNLMLPTDGDATWRTGYFAGQSMFTPENLSAHIPSANDRPYAGWLYGGARLWRETDTVLDKAEATLGIVGPSSLAADLQTSWHRLGLFGGVPPNGWHYQLHGEPGLVLSGQRIWRVGLLDGPLEAEVLPQADVSLGNIFDYAGAGTVLRVGSGLKGDWGPPRIAPALGGADFQAGDSFGWYAFAGVQGRAVARNIFLDGNSFAISGRIGHETLVGDFSAGAAVTWPWVRLMASYTNRSKEFAAQKGNDQFLSLTVSIAN